MQHYRLINPETIRRIIRGGDALRSYDDLQDDIADQQRLDQHDAKRRYSTEAYRQAVGDHGAVPSPNESDATSRTRRGASTSHRLIASKRKQLPAAKLNLKRVRYSNEYVDELCARIDRHLDDGDIAYFYDVQLMAEELSQELGMTDVPVLETIRQWCRSRPDPITINHDIGDSKNAKKTREEMEAARLGMLERMGPRIDPSVLVINSDESKVEIFIGLHHTLCRLSKFDSASFSQPVPACRSNRLVATYFPTISSEGQRIGPSFIIFPADADPKIGGKAIADLTVAAIKDELLKRMADGERIPSNLRKPALVERLRSLMLSTRRAADLANCPEGITVVFHRAGGVDNNFMHQPGGYLQTVRSAMNSARRKKLWLFSIAPAVTYTTKRSDR